MLACKVSHIRIQFKMAGCMLRGKNKSYHCIHKKCSLMNAENVEVKKKKTALASVKDMREKCLKLSAILLC